MSKISRRSFITVAGAAAAAGILSGCGASSSTAASTAPASTAASTASSAADTSASSGEVYMFISQPEYADAINTLIDEYKNVAPGVTINYETTQNDYPTLLKAKLNSGDVPDIFASTSGKEIDTYREWSYDLTGQPLTETMQDSVAAAMQSPEEGSGVYGIAIKGNYFGMVYNKALLEECGVTEFPATITAMKDACEKITAAGYKPFTTGFNEWWVFKHIWQHFLDAAADGAGISAAELVSKFEKGEGKVADYPEMYNNFFDFLDLAMKYGDDKPLETALDGEESAFGTGKAVFVLGQGAWIEADVLSIDPDLQIGFNGYPVTENAADCKVITGADQALRINKDSESLQQTLDFINWWYTSDYGKAWFTDVAGVVPPIKSDTPSTYAVISQGDELVSKNGSATLSIVLSTDSWNQTLGELLQGYLAGTTDKDATCAQIEEQWKAVDGAQ